MHLDPYILLLLQFMTVKADGAVQNCRRMISNNYCWHLLIPARFLLVGAQFSAPCSLQPAVAWEAAEVASCHHCR